ncbi:PLAC8-domain-containing protein [Terfezia boudieri ATCC MYA-4762]|uniref:PLAC8-domain-containing protein n=1 Tax=Terfezia boudieri ATCC MYA-4762 TaxID=1051890 RepID=A0A3N4LZ71_9PEZI|nr:PLAC8-domain-containing protein [Terfezia boudieri ATCC MYA-4762]
MSGYTVQQHTAYQPPHHQGAYNHQAAPEMQPQTPLMHHDHHPEKHAHSHNGEWDNGFCSCCSPFGTCCLGTWCPCILYGRTHHRLEHGSTQGYSCCNANCIFYGCLVLVSPLQTFLGYFQRKKIREKFGLKGGCCGDCLRHCCCPCCSLIQEEKEVIHMTKKAGYQASTGMHYPK